MINENTNTINATTAEKIEINRMAVESGRADMKFVNAYMKKDWNVKLIRKGKNVIVAAA